MNYSIIIRPLIGAGIGYITNWIAVKMMFRPLKEIKIGKFTLPFTPGIIPKNKERLAESIGNSISENLLTEETLKSTLLSRSTKLEIKENIISFLNSLTENNSTIKETICLYMEESSYNRHLENFINHLTSSIYDTIIKANLGNLVAEQIELAAKEKLKGSILGIFGGNAIISSISQNASLKVNNYIENNGEQLLNEMITYEINKYTSYTISDISTNIANSDIDLVSIIMNIYENFVINKLSQILNTINISNIVKEKINSMDTLELEKLILNIMKKELNALVNLGAIIGFILGLLNLLF